jgi:dienelactone hydrolase
MTRGLTIARGVQRSRGARRRWPVGAIALAVLALAGCAGHRVSFPTAAVQDPVRIPGALHKPSGSGPFPAAVILHGCGGVAPIHTTWARWLNENGYVALIVDSLTPRGFKEICSKGGPDILPTARFDDSMGALRYLQGLPSVDGARVGAIGFSNGGLHAIAVINGPSLDRARARGVALPPTGFAAAVGVYPGGCRSLVNEQVVKPLLVLIGEADDWTRADICVQMVRAMRSRGANAEIVVYPGAYHYFDVVGQKRELLADVENLNKPNDCCGATVAYDEPAATDARLQVSRFFARHLKR